MMHHLKWSFTRWREGLGIPGLAALALALFSLIDLPVVLWPAQQRLESLGKTTERPHGGGSEMQVTESPSRIFLTTFPKPSELSAELQTLFDIAARNNLDLGEVSYKQERKQDQRMEQYHVDFSLEAPYPETRAFLSDVLATLPHVSLDQLSFNRENVTSGLAQSHIRLTLHLVR